jgi:hypothetical protein
VSYRPPPVVAQEPAADPKLTADQIQQGELGDIGERIQAHLVKAERYDQKARDQDKKAQNHRVSAACLLAEAKAACTDEGFEAFHAKFCPELGRTRTFELLAIADGTKSLEQTRAETRKRVAKHRAKKAGKAAQSAQSVTAPVTDETEPKAITEGLETIPETEVAVEASFSMADEETSVQPAAIEAPRRKHEQVMRDRLEDIISANSPKLAIESCIDYAREHGTQADLETLFFNLRTVFNEVEADRLCCAAEKKKLKLPVSRDNRSQQQIKAAIWQHIKLGMNEITSLPRPQDVIDIVLAMVNGRGGDKIVRKIPVAIRWLQEFEKCLLS